MSGDMFKKMKDRITDEVNTATNKLQSMQIIDQLASSIGPQIRNDITPNQLLPEPHDPSRLDRPSKDCQQFTLIDGQSNNIYNEEEELNSDLSPQQQLFNESTIRKANLKYAKPSNDKRNSKTSMDNHKQEEANSNIVIGSDASQENVINFNDLSSDIDDGLEDIQSFSAREDGLDVEIDLLSDKPVYSINDRRDIVPFQDVLPLYKSKYRSVVRGLRRLNSDFDLERDELRSEKQELLGQITDIKSELDNLRRQQQPFNSTQNESLKGVSKISENDKSSTGSPQSTTKSASKIKDLERLLTKCKESLKHKNTIISNLRESLSEVEKFKDSNQELKQELGELKEAHETWTVSIAESKRVMHHEIENKNSEIERLKAESHEQQFKLSDSNNKVRQLKSAIQDLESRLVSTSAAHQKERESLTKELTAAKNNAMRHLQKEHENNIERVKLDLEKSIEALKLDILTKDEQLMKNAEQLQRIYEENRLLSLKLEESSQKLKDQSKNLEEVKKNNSSEMTKVSELESELNNLREQLASSKDLDERNKELLTELDSLRVKLSTAEAALLDNSNQQSELYADKECKRCDDSQNHSKQRIEELKQELHQLNTKLGLMNTANDDQEKEIKLLKTERKSLLESHKLIKSESEESAKKYEQLARAIKENEYDLQSQQDQLDHMKSLKRELEHLKKENGSISDSLNRVKLELSEKNNESHLNKNLTEELRGRISSLQAGLDNSHNILEDLRNEKDSIIRANELLGKQKREAEEKLVMKILSVIKNLETPNTSPGSDKSYNFKQEDSSTEGENKLPDPFILMEALSSLALDKSNSSFTATQRLQAVLLENSLLSEELKRLKDELTHLNREKSHEAQCSIEEGEKLRTENQALIYDQQAYDDRIKDLELEVESLTTQFEYLKNIVYQFMLGKEPLVLARVISAVFKFDKSQLEQICRAQEAVSKPIS